MKALWINISRGLLFICLGVIFFLINFGLLSWNFWLSVLDLWPLILILLGIGLLFNKQLPLSTILLVFLIVLAGYSLIFGERHVPWNPLDNYFYQDNGTNTSAKTMTTDIPLPAGIERAQLDMDLGGAQINLQSLIPSANQDLLLKGSYSWRNVFGSSQPQFQTSQEGDTLNISFSSARHGGMGNRLQLELSPQVRYSLDIEAGAITGNLDFSSLKTEKLQLKTGASDFQLQFGDTGLNTTGKIESGASRITLVVPDDVGLHIHLNGVGTETNFMGSGLLLNDKEWLSPGYEEARTKVDLDISCAAGSVHLVRPEVQAQTAI
jgi:hypothetical protein